MSRRGAGIAGARVESPATLQFMETPALGRVVLAAARQLLSGGLKAPEVSSLLAQVAAHLAQQGDSRLSREEWLTLCSVLWDEAGSDPVLSPGGQA